MRSEAVQAVSDVSKGSGCLHRSGKFGKMWNYRRFALSQVSESHDKNISKKKENLRIHNDFNFSKKRSQLKDERKKSYLLN